MFDTLRRALVLALLVAALTQGTARADDARPIQLSLVPSVQLYPETTSIQGARLAIVGRNAKVQGVDFGLVTFTTGDFSGVSWGIANIVDGKVQGYQNTVVNYSRGEVEGMQWGILNRAATMTGVQWAIVNLVDSKMTGWELGGLNLVQKGHSKGFLLGAVNVTEDMEGFQLGFVNVTNRMHGLQVGLINIIKLNGVLPVLPLVNWSF
jgi:hypothetical protein